MGIFGKVFDEFLPVGVEIVFLGQPRISGLLNRFDPNSEGKYALDVRYVGNKKNQMTGYWFNADDFSPALNSIDIKSYAGLIVCWKNIFGQNNFMPPELKVKNEKIETLHKMLDIHKRKIIDLISIIEGKHISEEKKSELLEDAKKLKALKEIVTDKEFLTKREASAMSGTRLFSR